jgi:predicted nucleic acid-binding protein
MGFADAQIAATTVLEKAFLLTNNQKDFRSIPNLRFFKTTI